MRAHRVAMVLLAIAGVACAPRMPADALPVPAVRQATGYSCGPAALLAVLRYWQRPVAREEELYAPLHTTVKDGTEPAMLAAVARSNGLDAELRTGLTVEELRAALAGGATVILDLQAWRETAARAWRDDWDDGHYVVLVALDRDRLYAMDPSSPTGFAWLPVGELLERWHDFEDRGGTRRDYVHAAVIVRGSRHVIARAPRPVRMQ